MTTPNFRGVGDGAAKVVIGAVFWAERGVVRRDFIRVMEGVWRAAGLMLQAEGYRLVEKHFGGWEGVMLIKG